MAEPKPSSVQRRVPNLKGLIPIDIGNVTPAFQTAVKWYFDLIRNLLIAGSLKFLSGKAGSSSLDGSSMSLVNRVSWMIAAGQVIAAGQTLSIIGDEPQALTGRNSAAIRSGFPAGFNNGRS